MVRTRGAARRADDARLARLVRDVEVRRAAAADAAARTRCCAATRSATSRRSRSTSPATPRCCCGSTARPTTAGTSTRTTRASCRSCSASAPGTATARATSASSPARSPASATTGTTPVPARFRFDKKFHDAGPKRIYGKRGKFGWQEGVRLVTRHRRHPEFMVTKLWSYFIPSKPSPSTVKALSRMYVAGGREVRPLLEAILAHPDLYAAGSGWSSRRSCRPRGCCARSAAGSTRTRGRGCATARASTSSCRPT